MTDDVPERIIEHLDEALDADELDETDFHVRQAQQLVMRLTQDDENS